MKINKTILIMLIVAVITIVIYINNPSVKIGYTKQLINRLKDEANTLVEQYNKKDRSIRLIENIDKEKKKGWKITLISEDKYKIEHKLFIWSKLCLYYENGKSFPFMIEFNKNSLSKTQYLYISP